MIMQTMTPSIFFRNLSSQDFEEFGSDHLAYIKPKGGGFAVHGADGKMLAIKTDFASAVTTARYHDLQALTLQ